MLNESFEVARLYGDVSTAASRSPKKFGIEVRAEEDEVRPLAVVERQQHRITKLYAGKRKEGRG
jgi:hypothetical protein